MKTTSATLAALAMVAAMNVSLPTAAVARANDNVEQCRLLVSFNVFETQGECMGSLRSQAPRTCRLLRDYDVLDFFGFRNVGDCVSFYRSVD